MITIIQNEDDRFDANCEYGSAIVGDEGNNVDIIVQAYGGTEIACARALRDGMFCAWIALGKEIDALDEQFYPGSANAVVNPWLRDANSDTTDKTSVPDAAESSVIPTRN